MQSVSEDTIKTFGRCLPTIKIGDSLWLSHDFDFDDCGDGILNNGTTYYTWDAVQRVVSKMDGWHLPSVQEWNDACEAVGFKSMYHNRFLGQPQDFNDPGLRLYSGCDLQKVLGIYPIGLYDEDKKLSEVGWNTAYWSATDSQPYNGDIPSPNAYCRGFGKPADVCTVHDMWLPKTLYLPVRLVKDCP